MSRPILIAAGGTGGHLIPALAIAAAVGREDPEALVTFIGGEHGLERELVPKAGYRIETTGIRPFAASPRALATAAGSILPAVRAAREILRRVEARAVLGMGGYPSLPAVFAARTLGIPTLLHEQNAVPGLANQLGAMVTRHIGAGFPTTARIGRRRARFVGVPVREEILAAGAIARDEAAVKLGLDPARRTVLVLGGSLGARSLNACGIALARRWRDRADVQLLVGTGARDHPMVASQVDASAEILVRAEPFLDRMDLAYAAADIVLCRAGASTIYELAAAGPPALLVPYPHARRKEQHANAALLVGIGAAEVLADGEGLPDRAIARIEQLLADGPRLAEMRAAARTVATPHAAAEIARWLLALSRGADG